MNASTRWLRELCAIEATDDQIAERLTAAGLEVEGSREIGAGLVGAIVAEVRASRPHPKADKLTLVDVFDGRAVAQVVCGAPNVPAPGGKVVWAPPGARLPSGVELAAREVRGIVSPGMLCAEDELGLSDDHGGIVILDAGAPGEDAAPLLGLPDRVLELNVTPNRPDCLGHLGLARELCALFEGARLLPLDPELARFADEASAGDLAEVELEDAAGCPRYLARVLAGTKVGVAPLAARLRLERLGVRAISDVVDATNLTLLEVGHPLHAFDLDRLAGRKIVVRRARPGEKITTLDGQERSLGPEDVAICDAERPVAVAGVMGGQTSEVGPDTRAILLESAWFEPARIRRTGRRLGLSTEASQRFERGCDPNRRLELASARCAERIARWTGARIARGVIDRYPQPIAPKRVVLRPARTEHLLGVAVPESDQRRILEALGLHPVPEGDALACAAPTHRPDLTREADLIEEVARVWGYDRVPPRLPAGLGPVDPGAKVGGAESVRDALAALGLSETVSYAFVSPERAAALGFVSGDPRARPLALSNPLREEVSLLRTSLVPGLLQAVARNQSHGVFDQALFEVGTCFFARRSPAPPPTARGDHRLPDEEERVAGVLAGARPGWLKPGGAVDVYDAKGVVEGLLARRGVAGTFRASAAGEAPWLHPGLAATVIAGGSAAGVVGEVHPEVRARFGVEGACFAFDLALAPLAAEARISFHEPPRLPGSSRDVSFFVDAAVSASEIAEAIAAASPLIEAVLVREDYREAGRVPAGKKGMLWSVAYRSRERTLTDDEVSRAHASVLASLTARFAIAPR